MACAARWKVTTASGSSGRAGLFHALNTNDIYTVAAPITGRGYFDNIGDTLRQGIEIGGRYTDQRWMVYANYALVHATFQSSFVLPSPNNPAAFECGEDDGEELTCVQVNDGDRIPGIPLSRFKTGFDYLITPQWRFGADLLAASSQIFFGDEGNDTAPLGGYAKVDLHTYYDLTENVQLYGLIYNLFNSQYGLFGNYFNLEAGERGFGGEPGHRRRLLHQPAHDHAGSAARGLRRYEDPLLIAG